MKELYDYIKESLIQDELNYKLNTWLKAYPNEQHYWYRACKSWNDTHQFDDDAVRDFMAHTDIRGFIDFMNGEVSSDEIHSDDFDIVKKIISNL